MSNLLLSESEQGLIIFHIWKSLNYKLRLGLSMIFILAGLILQYWMFFFFPGALLVLAGNLLLLVKGYDNRVKLDTFKPGAEWVKTDEKHLTDVVAMNKKMEKWDISAFDITSPLGVAVFIAFLAGLIILSASLPFSSTNGNQILLINAVILIFPHWFTGVKRITTTPALVKKIDLYLNLMAHFAKEIEMDSVNYLMLMDGNKKLPIDVKMKVDFKDQPDDFMGMYAQIAMNDVQGTAYPYFYVVLVGKASSKLLSKYYQSTEPPFNLTREFKTEGDAEIIVIRQITTKNSGYFTDVNAIVTIFSKGLDAARKVNKK
jgi:hypothetical protein